MAIGLFLGDDRFVLVLPWPVDMKEGVYDFPAFSGHGFFDVFAVAVHEAFRLATCKGMVHPFGVL